MPWETIFSHVFLEALKTAPTTAVLVIAILVAMRKAGNVATGTTTAVTNTTETLGAQITHLTATISDLRNAVTVLNASLVKVEIGQARLDERMTSVERRLELVGRGIGD